MNLRRFVSPEDTIEKIGLDKKSMVIDFGCGAGHWTFAVAKKLGPTGKTVAIDINADLLNRVKSFAMQRGYGNVEVLFQNILTLDPAKLLKADLSILANTLSASKTKEAVIKKVYDLTKDGGKLLVVEWSNEESLIGPAKKHRMSKKDLVELAEGAGFKTLGEVETGHYHYGIVFEK